MFKNFFYLYISFSFAQYAPSFDGEKAYEHLLKQCSFGPRYPGSDAHKKLKNYFVSFLNEYADSVKVMEHEISHPYINKKINLYNILAQFNPTSENRILLMAHWDTREIADKDYNIENRNTPIMGANDGGSGIAILMAFAELFKLNEFINIGVDLLFVDGEDMGRAGETENFCLGSRLYAKSQNSKNTKLAICLDMVADIDAEFKIEYFSYIQAPEIVKEIWSLANSLGYSEFTTSFQSPIYDDHRALFVETGIPSIDIIDFDYPYWHTLEDTPDKCSAKTLQIVGHVVSEYIYRKDGM